MKNQWSPNRVSPIWSGMHSRTAPYYFNLIKSYLDSNRGSPLLFIIATRSHLIRALPQIP